LEKFNLLNTTHRKDNFDEIFHNLDYKPNSSHSRNFWKRLGWGVYFLPGCGFIIYVSKIFMIQLELPSYLRLSEKKMHFLLSK